jgi:hypothetical protein
MHWLYFVVAKQENGCIPNCRIRFRLWSVGTPTTAFCPGWCPHSQQPVGMLRGSWKTYKPLFMIVLNDIAKVPHILAR